MVSDVANLVLDYPNWSLKLTKTAELHHGYSYVN